MPLVELPLRRTLVELWGLSLLTKLLLRRARSTGPETNKQALNDKGKRRKRVPSLHSEEAHRGWDRVAHGRRRLHKLQSRE
jgi:hypothetical protein